jgi:hypothetical protein
MAEAAQALAPELEVTGVERLGVLAGVLLERGPLPIRVRARRVAGEGGVQVETALVAGDRERRHYEARVTLAPSLPPPRAAPAPLAGLEPFALSVAQAYDAWLFHGPLFRAIAAVHGVGPDGIRAELRTSMPDACVDGAEGDWLVDPVVLDGAFQLSILWARANLDMTPLPARLGRLHRFAPLRGERLLCELHARPAAGGHVLHTDITLLDAAGRPLVLLEDMEFSCSPSLNRLAAGVRLEVVS